MPTTTQITEYNGEVLFVSLELAAVTWKIYSSPGRGFREREKHLKAGDIERLVEEFGEAKRKFGLPEDAMVVCCYEAGRDGFWVQRELSKRGVTCIVVDPSSIEVNRRARRRKTDRIDGCKLLQILIRWVYGEQSWSIAVVPTVEQEDARQLHRELEVLKRERGQHRVRIQSLLITHGVPIIVANDFPGRLGRLRQVDGQPLPPGLEQRLRREYKRLEMVNEQIRQVEAERRKILKTSEDTTVQIVRKLQRLRSIGDNSAWVFGKEMFWRSFSNRREVGAFAGLTPTPYDSGESRWEQGISKAGNPRVRRIAIEIAWCWLRFQPNSELARWFRERFGQGRRARKVGIVALARRLLIALWRYVEFDVIPEGAELKAA